MLNKKIATVTTLFILVVSTMFMLFGESILGDYIIVAKMMVIVSGLVSVVLVIASRQEVIRPRSSRTGFDFSLEDNVGTKICNICNTENKENAISCIKCGSNLNSVTCPICNTVNSYDQKYCKNCDTILQNKKRH